MNKWNDISTKKGKIFGKKPSPILVKAIQIWKPKKNQYALDIGAYTGRNSIYLNTKKFKVIALDSAKEPLKQLKKNSIKTINKKIENYKWKKFDCIVCINVLQFITPKKVTKIIKQMKKNTNQKGINVITVFLTKPFKTQKKTFKHNELKKHYSDWKILHYNEKTGKLATGGKVRVANLIAQKTKP